MRMNGHGPFTVLWSIPPWWLRGYPLIMEPPVKVGLHGRSPDRGPSLNQQTTVMAPIWQGPTPLILGPSSWGFGIAGTPPGTAYAPPIQWPSAVPVYTKPGPYGL